MIEKLDLDVIFVKLAVVSIKHQRVQWKQAFSDREFKGTF